MKPVNESLYVGTRLICTKLSIWHNQGEAVISSVAYFCPTCGDIWARRIFLVEGLRFRAYERPCEQHGDGSLVFSEVEWSQILQELPTPDHERAHVAHFPIEWLAYELFLIVRRYP